MKEWMKDFRVGTVVVIVTIAFVVAIYLLAANL